MSPNRNHREEKKSLSSGNLSWHFSLKVKVFRTDLAPESYLFGRSQIKNKLLTTIPTSLLYLLAPGSVLLLGTRSPDIYWSWHLAGSLFLYSQFPVWRRMCNITKLWRMETPLSWQTPIFCPPNYGDSVLESVSGKLPSPAISCPIASLIFPLHNPFLHLYSPFIASLEILHYY